MGLMPRRMAEFELVMLDMRVRSTYWITGQCTIATRLPRQNMNAG